MTEQDWLTSNVAYQPLIYIRETASVRKLRLVAAAYARWLQTLPAYKYARPCADVIEEVADEPKSWSELEPRLFATGNDWSLAGTLIRDEQAGAKLSMMVIIAEDSFTRRSENSHHVHQVMLGLLHEVFGNPFRPATVNSTWLAWNGGTIRNIAQAIYDERAFDRMPILADALEDAGCDNADILRHCREPGEHVRGCWVIDLLLGKK
jgi:hypothetical protein